MQEAKRPGWAIVGLGGLSLYEILPAFADCKSSRLTAFVSGHRDKANNAAARFGVEPKNIYNYQNFGTIKNNPDIDIVYIVLPNGLHAEYTIRALQAGKHVLCEKPMANTADECREMIAAAKKADRKLMIAYRCQYEPNNLAAIQMCRSGGIGVVRSIVADHGFNIGPNQWRLDKKLAGGGSLMDIGIYSLNAARYLTGEEPTEVSAELSNLPNDPRFREVEDTVHFLLRFPSGALANCTSSYGYAGANRYQIIGTKGIITLEPATAYRGIQMVIGRGRRQENPVVNQFATEMDHMSECVTKNRVPKTPGEEGLRDLSIIERIYEAAKTGRTVKLTPPV